jgi:hypothetical protein
VTVSLFQISTEPPLVAGVRFEGGQGKHVKMGPQQIFPRWFTLLLQALLIFGVFSLIYFIIRAFV